MGKVFKSAKDDVAPVPPEAGRKAVCTICSNNYLHFARTLMQSLRETQPDWDAYVLLVDENRGVFDPAKEPFTVVELSELPLPNSRAFCFRYTILELNTAVKPWILDYLFERKGYDQVVYLDPDIFVYKPLVEVEKRLDAGAFMVLTPHLTGPLDDDLKPSELEILRAGAYNLGFIALRRHPNLRPFLAWWRRKVEYDCVVDFEKGLFVDQRWMDLVPGIFGDVAILRHPAYNVAYWNLKHREVTRQGARCFVSDRSAGEAPAAASAPEPLAFFHFSGLDPLNPGPFSKHQDRFSMANLGVVKPLVRDYCDRVLANGLLTCRAWPYAFGVFADGQPILDCMRRYFREHLEPEGRVKGDPFELGHDYFHTPWGKTGPDGALVTILMRAIWETRKDLQMHFPDLEGANRWDYAYWFTREIAKDFKVPSCCVQLVQRSLQGPAGEGAQALPRRPFWNPFRMMRWARKLLPRRTQRRMWELAHPAPGHMLQRPSLLRRAARRLPTGVKRFLRSMITPGKMAPTAAPARAAASLRRPRGMLYYMGFFDQEEPLESRSAWMGSGATVRILSPQAGTLCISGEYHPHYFVQAGLSADTVLDAAVDGKPLAPLVLRRDGAFELSVDVPPPPAGKQSATLTLTAGQCFVPARIGLGADLRSLSVRISRVTLNDTVLLDFSRHPNPFMPDTDIPVTALGLNIIGYLRSELGVGESARLCAASAAAAEIDRSLVDFTAGCSSRTGDDRLSRLITNENPHAVNLFHINADQMPLAHSCLGDAFFQDRYNIGFWHWELPEFPDEWVSAFGFLQEVWVPSMFVMSSVGAKSPVPVVRMPHAVGISVPDGLARAALGLPEAKFLFLMMYDMHSFQSRKNPEAALEAFRKAFPRSDDVALVIKTMNTKTYPREWAELQERLAELPGTVVINRTLSRQDVYNLESLCDCFLSLHRSEGFGLGLAESMYLGKPVIGTNWSGNVDFMNETNSCPVRYALTTLEQDFGPYKKGQRWAEADRDHAAWFMKKLVEDADFRRSIALAGQQTIRADFSHKAVGEMYRKRLEIISKLL